MRCATIGLAVFFLVNALVTERKKRRLEREIAIREHRLHHVQPHPNGGTFPYARPICECDQFDGEAGG